jgi:Holliday junction resolvase RusA-like endonuclease
MLILEIPIDPVAKGRPRISTLHGRPIAFTPKETRNAERVMATYARAYMRDMGEKPLEGALRVVVSFALRRPKSVKRLAPTTKPDLDNYVKMLDALNGICWLDDSQVVTISALKRYCDEGEEPNICIKITEFLTAKENGHKKTTIRGKGVK